MSWLHIADLLAVVRRCLDDPALSGVVHAASPQPVRNAELMAGLDGARRPPAPPTPAPLVRLGSLLLRTDPALALMVGGACPDGGGPRGPVRLPGTAARPAGPAGLSGGRHRRRGGGPICLLRHRNHHHRAGGLADALLGDRAEHRVPDPACRLPTPAGPPPARPRSGRRPGGPRPPDRRPAGPEPAPRSPAPGDPRPGASAPPAAARIRRPSARRSPPALCRCGSRPRAPPTAAPGGRRRTRRPRPRSDRSRSSTPPHLALPRLCDTSPVDGRSHLGQRRSPAVGWTHVQEHQGAPQLRATRD